MTLFALLLLSGLASAAEIYDGFAYYLGDVHVHTGASGDGGSVDIGTCTGTCGALVDVADDARANGLDFMAILDHVNGTPAASPEDFARSWQATLDADAPDDGFVAIPGSEVWFSLPDEVNLGHRSMLFFGSDEDLAGIDMAALQPLGDAGTEVAECSVLWSWASEVEATFGPVLMFPHHPGTKLPAGTDWSCHDPHFAPVVEVYSEHGNSDMPDTVFDPPDEASPSGTVATAMSPTGYGYRLGFVGGTDSHDTDPGGVCSRDGVRTQQPYGGGLTVAVLQAGEQFDRTALYASMVNRRTYATSGPLVPTQVEYFSGGARLGAMGEVIAVPEGQPLDVEVSVPQEYAPFVSEVMLRMPGVDPVGLVAKAGQTFSVSLPSSELKMFVYAEIVLDGGAFYGEAGCDDGGIDHAEHLWLSPSWIIEGPADLDGDGWAFLAGDCDDGDAAVAPDVWEVCDNGVDENCDGLVDEADPACGVAVNGAIDAVVLEDYSGEVSLDGKTLPTTDSATQWQHGCSVVPFGGWVVALAGILAAFVRRPVITRG